MFGKLRICQSSYFVLLRGMKKPSSRQLNLFGPDVDLGAGSAPPRRRPPPDLDKNRYFFAFRPPADATHSIDVFGRGLCWSLGSHSRLLGPSRYHITLGGIKGPGEAPDWVIAALMAVGGSVTAPIFDIAFDHARGYGQPGEPRAVFLASTQTISVLDDFYRRLCNAMQANGFRTNSAFNPHLTLFYDEHPVTSAINPPVCFTVRDLVLIRSIYGTSRHDHLAHWSLGG